MLAFGRIPTSPGFDVRYSRGRQVPYPTSDEPTLSWRAVTAGSGVKYPELTDQNGTPALSRKPVSTARSTAATMTRADRFRGAGRCDAGRPHHHNPATRPRPTTTCAAGQ